MLTRAIICLQSAEGYAKISVMVTYDRAQVNEMIRRMQGKRSLRGFAIDLNLSAAYLSDILRCNREPGPQILSRLKLKRIKETTIKYVRG